MNCLCVIPARGGSKRLPRKNAMMLEGEPIIYWPINAAWDSGLFERVIVSTDDEEIADIVDPYIEVEWRDPRLCLDDVTDIEVVSDIAERYDYRHLCYIYPTAVLVTARQIVRGYSIYRDSTAPWLRCTVCGRDAGHFYWYDLDAVRAGSELHLRDMEIDPMECQDINTMEDFELAEIKKRLM